MAVKRKSDSESIEEGRQNKRVATEAERDAEGAQASGNGNNAENEEDEVEDASTNSSIGCSLVHARSITSGSCWVLQNRGGATGGLDIDTVFESATQQVEDECTKAEEKSSQVSISETEKERIISDLMRKLYFHQARRPNQPLSKTELLKVLEKYRGKGINDFALSQCKKRFLEIFGYKIVELTKFSRKMKTSRSADKESASTAKSIIFVNALGEEQRTRVATQADVVDRNAFILIVLSLIVTSGGELLESLLMEYLDKLGIPKDSKKFGPLPELLEELNKELYLVRVRQPDSEYRLSLGERVEHEIGQNNVTSFIERIMAGPAS